MAKKPTYKELQEESARGKQTQEALEQSEATLKSVLLAAPIGIGVVANRIFRFVNDQMCQIVGYSRKELVGRSARILYESDQEFERVGQVKYDRLRAKGIGTIETQFVRRDGILVDILLSSCAIDPSDLSQGVTFTALDITERKEAERALRESEANYRLLFSAGSDAIIVVDGETKEIVDANDAASALYGYTKGELVKMKATDFSAEPEASAIHIDEVAAGKPAVISPGPIQRLHKKKDGGTFPVEVSSGVYVLKDRKLVCAVIRDITERKRMEEALRNSYDELEVRLKERTEALVGANEGLKREIEERKLAENGLRESEERLRREERRMEVLKFANDVALKLMHELRNPLVTIGGFSRRLSDGDYTEEKLREYAKVIFDGSKRLDHVLAEVLNHLKAAAGEV